MAGWLGERKEEGEERERLGRLDGERKGLELGTLKL